MKSIKGVSLMVVAFVVLFNYGCSKKSENAIDFGKFEGNTYSNTFFNLNVSIPETWYVMDDEARAALMQKSKKIVAGDDKNLNASLDALDLKHLALVTASEKPPGTPVSSNPSFILIAENIKHAPGIKRGRDYHFHTKKMLESSQLEVSFPKEIYEIKIDGISFDVLETAVTMGNLINFQRQYAAVINQYVLLIGLTYQDNEGLWKLEEILQTMKMS